MVDDSQTINNWRLGAVLFLWMKERKFLLGKDMESEMIMRTFDFCLKFCHFTLFRLTPPLNLSTHRAEPRGVYFSLPNCLKPGVSEGRLDGFR